MVRTSDLMTSDTKKPELLTRCICNISAVLPTTHTEGAL